MITQQYAAWLAKARANEGSFGLAGPVIHASDAAVIARASSMIVTVTTSLQGLVNEGESGGGLVHWGTVATSNYPVQLETVNAGNGANLVDFWGAGALFGGGDDVLDSLGGDRAGHRCECVMQNRRCAKTRMNSRFRRGQRARMALGAGLGMISEIHPIAL